MAMVGARCRAWPLLAATLAAGCPGTRGRPATPAGPPAPETVEIEPFGPSRPANQALILGTGAGTRSSIIPLAAEAHTVAVDGTWADPSGPAGGTGTVRLTTTPQAGGLLRVGVSWSFATTDQEWRSVAWVGAFAATSLLGLDLADYRFDALNTGRTDRAAAGALVAAGFLAALTGGEVAPDVAVIGIVNPDGTLGPVTGLPQHVAAAVAAGKKRVGIPTSQPIALDRDSGTAVDLAARASAGHATAVPIADLYGAYTLLTGRPLPGPQPVAAADMALSPAVESALNVRYRAWRGELGHEWAQLVALRAAGRLPGAIAALATLADARGRDAEKRLRDGAAVTAYRRIVEAVTYARAANTAASVLAPVQTGNLDEARRLLAALQATAPDRSPIEALGHAAPGTIGAYLTDIAALAQATAGWSFERFAADQMAPAVAALHALDGKTPDELADPELQEQLMNALVPPLLARARGVTRARVAADLLALGGGASTAAFAAPTPAVNRLASAYAAVATADLAGCGRRLLAGLPRNGPGDGVPQVALMRADPDYLVAHMAFELWRQPTGAAAAMRDTWGPDSATWSLARLAGSLEEYGATAVVVAREYSLGAHLDGDTGEPVSVSDPAALAKLLVGAERAARQHAHAARVATGSIPLQARLRYQHARALAASKNAGDRVAALQAYWASSAYAQLAVALVRIAARPAVDGAAAGTAGSAHPGPGGADQRQK